MSENIVENQEIKEIIDETKETEKVENKMIEHYLKTHILKDEYMEQFRHIYFNDSL